MKEHLLTSGRGTTFSCSCGKVFGIEQEAAQHQWWNLQLATAGKDSQAYQATLNKTTALQEEQLAIMREFLQVFRDNTEPQQVRSKDGSLSKARKVVR